MVEVVMSMHDRMISTMVFVGCMAMAGAMAILALSECKPACTAVDVAHGLCFVFSDADGGTQTMQVPGEDLQLLLQLEQGMQVKRAMQADGGSHD
jgi:hypothetical protein